MLIPDLLNILFDQSDYGSLLVLRSMHRRKTMYANKYSLLRHYDKNETSMMELCTVGQLKAVKCIIDKVDIHVGHENMLHWSADCLELFKYLVTVGADIHAASEYALRHCASNGYMDTLKYLVSIGANVNLHRYHALKCSLFNNRLSAAKYLISVGANIGDTEYALETCAELGYVEMLKCLVDSGVDVHAFDDFALKKSASNGQFEMVKCLVEVGANIRADNDYALRLSKENGHIHIHDYLMSKINGNM